MKLSQIHEARYTTHPAVDFVLNAIKQRKYYETVIDRSEIEPIIRSLIPKLGQPDLGPDDDDWLVVGWNEWETSIGQDIEGVDPTKYALVTNGQYF